MRGLQNIKLNKGGFVAPLILVKGAVKYRNRNLQNLIIIYIVSGFTCNNNSNDNNNNNKSLRPSLILKFE